MTNERVGSGDMVEKQLAYKYQVYNEIKKGIMSGVYPAGSVMNERKLSEELGISRQHLAAIEAPNMNRGLSLELLFNIATVLEIEPYLLLKFSPEK